MAGASGNGNIGSINYLDNGDCYWSMAPYYFNDLGAYEFEVAGDGYVHLNSVRNICGLRPVISLKPGIEFLADVDGTPTNPYIVKYD